MAKGAERLRSGQAIQLDIIPDDSIIVASQPELSSKGFPPYILDSPNVDIGRYCFEPADDIRQERSFRVRMYPDDAMKVIWHHNRCVDFSSRIFLWNLMPFGIDHLSSIVQFN